MREVFPLWSMLKLMSNQPQQNLYTPASAILPAITKLLRPLVKLMLHYQITYPQCSAALKATFISVAEESFKEAEIGQTDSSISFLTGINRKEVKRLRAQENAEQNADKTASARIFSRWLASDDLHSSQTQSKPLPLQEKQNPARNFNAFVKAECRNDIRPKVVLNEWLRQGLVVLENGALKLNAEAISPKRGFEQKASFFGSNIEDHIHASSHNLMGYKPSFFDRSVYCEDLSSNSIKQLEQVARELGMDALTKMNALAQACQTSDKGDITAQSRFKFGVFSFHLQGSEESTSIEKQQTSRNAKI